jgi:ADP-ribose pyrophosphatase YjhB (NUDIX family)
MTAKTRFAFCPVCGGRLELGHPHGLADEPPEMICQTCGFVFWQNSKPCAGVLVVRDGRLLLVKRAFAPYRNWWDIPGGFLKVGEHPEDGAAREVREETGLTVRLTGLVGIFMDVYGATGDATLNVFYTGEVIGGSESAGSDAAGLRWFAATEIPKNVAFACNRQAIAAWLKGSKATV